MKEHRESVKAGREYEELAGKLAEALHPGSDVKIGQWIVGPDGDREVDVEVRSRPPSRPWFLLIECKDWKTPVGIGEIDKLESKSRDLCAHETMICSNRGFTKDALRKASRVGIKAISVMASGNRKIGMAVTKEQFARLLSVDKWQMTLYPTDESDKTFPDDWDTADLYYDDRPVVNWVSAKSAELLLRHEGKSEIVATYAFKVATPFRLADSAIVLKGLRLLLECSSKWVSQTTHEDVSLGYFDHKSGKVTVPSKQLWYGGMLDMEGWKDAEEPEKKRDEPLKPNSFRVWFRGVRPVPEIDDNGAPPIDDLIGQHRVVTKEERT